MFKTPVNQNKIHLRNAFQAISAMKVSGRLELIIREGAGIELVSPESSGYNSSASSAAGERSPAPLAPLAPLAPPAALRRRLASVAEEAADRADRLVTGREGKYVLFFVL